MIVRVVRMTFRLEEVTNFLTIFDQHKHQIRHFQGCKHLELMKDPERTNVLSTYSHWDSVEHLDAYRHSLLFEEVWAKTKVLFEAKPVAFSLKSYLKVE